MLELCSTTFGTERARYIRQLQSGEWQVHSLKSDLVVTHQADYAEIAMAWAVGLSRFPIRVTRPRITDLDGGSVRPIAVTTYFGIPVLCGDHLVGVIELAGNVAGDLLRTLETVAVELERFGNRMIHDPSLRAPQQIDIECECWIDGGCWSHGRIEITSDEWRLLSEIGEPELLSSVADRVDCSDSELIDLVRSLVSRGVVSVRATTRVLPDPAEIDHNNDCVAAGD